MAQDSSWGTLDPEAALKLKGYVRQAVADGMRDALANGDMQRSIADGVASGMRSVAEDEDLFDLLTSRTTAAFKRSATRASGEFVVDSVKGLAKRIAWFVVLGALVYSLGGWAGLAALWKTISHSST